MCYGEASRGKLGSTYCGTQSCPPAVVTLDGTSTPLTNVVKVGAATQYTCALTSDGKVYCWGMGTVTSDDLTGQWGDTTKHLGLGPSDNVDHWGAVMVPAFASKTMDRLAVGMYQSCAREVGTGKWTCWQQDATPLSSAFDNVDMIQPTMTGLCVLGATGAVACANQDPQNLIGNGTKEAIGPLPDFTKPVQRDTDNATMDQVMYISVAHLWGCAIQKDCAVRCWGEPWVNDTWQGIGTASSRAKIVAGVNGCN